MSKETFKLMDDRILVRTQEAVAATPGGIVLPPTAQRTSNQLRSEVVAVGPGSVMLFQAGHRTMSVKPGDTVIHEHRGNEFDYEGEKLFMLREPDILAIVK